jgi:hypothetical protein
VDENTEESDLIGGLAVSGSRLVAIAIWVYLMVVIVIGAVGDLLHWQVLLNIASIGAMVFLIVAGVLILVVACIAFVAGAVAVVSNIRKVRK